MKHKMKTSKFSMHGQNDNDILPRFMRIPVDKI